MAGIVSVRLMKSLGDAVTAKDGTKEGGILMAGAVGQIAAPCIAGLGARALVRGSRVGVPPRMATDAEHGDEDAPSRDHEVSLQKGLGGACPHRQMASVIIGPPQQGQRCARAATAALSASGSRASPRSGQQPAAQFEPGGAMTIGEEAVVADAMEAVGKRVQQEAADELERVERHDLRPAVMAIVPPAEADAIVGHADQPGIGDGDAMGVAAEIRQHLLGPPKGGLA